MATKKAGGSSRNGRDSAGRRLGVKKFGGEFNRNVIENGGLGNIIFFELKFEVIAVRPGRWSFFRR